MDNTIPPPIGAVPASSAGFRFRPWHLVVLLLLCLPILGAVAVANCFRLSSASRVLRGSLMESVGGQWDKKFAVHVGSLPMCLVRWGSHCVQLPPEPRAALDTLHGAEVGIYRLRDDPSSLNTAAIFNSADQAMKAQGWDRVVGVAQERQLVAVYLPSKSFRPTGMSCCVMVFHDRELVIVSARGNLEPLMEIARKRMDHFHNHHRPWLSRVTPAFPRYCGGNSSIIVPSSATFSLGYFVSSLNEKT